MPLAPLSLVPSCLTTPCNTAPPSAAGPGAGPAACASFLRGEKALVLPQRSTRSRSCELLSRLFCSTAVIELKERVESSNLDKCGVVFFAYLPDFITSSLQRLSGISHSIFTVKCDIGTTRKRFDSTCNFQIF